MSTNSEIQQWLDEAKSDVSSVWRSYDESTCIFSAPRGLLKEYEEAYVPRIVSIGPYHFLKEELRQMERFKGEAVRRQLVRIQNKLQSEFSCDQLIDRIFGKVGQILRCYDKEVPYSADVVCWMVARDACFILEFFRCLFHDSVGDSDNLERLFPDFRSNFNPVVRSEILKDLIKLENQIPLFVLEQVLSMELGGDLDKAKSSLQLLLKAVFNRFYYRPFDSYVASGECLRQNHILDIYYHCCLGDEDNRSEEKQKVEELQEQNQNSKELWVNLGNYVDDLEKHQSERHKVPSAVELGKGGVKIQATGKTVKDIGFQGGTLYIPPVQMDSESEIFIRNLMALENCHPDGSSRRMTAFVQFMNELSQTDKGAAVMRESGVIVGNLLQDSQITRLFSCSIQSYSVPSYDPIEVARTNLMKYYSKTTRIAATKAWNEFRETYFSKPWILIGGIGATIILILTAIQVFCLFHSCGAH